MIRLGALNLTDALICFSHLGFPVSFLGVPVPQTPTWQHVSITSPKLLKGKPMKFAAQSILLSLLLITYSDLTWGGETVKVTGKITAIDLDERRLVIVPANSKQKIDLELTRKTRIKRDTEVLGIDAIKNGDTITIQYDSELLVVIAIELGATGPTEALNLEELNGPTADGHPWVSSDGKEIFWTVYGADPKNHALDKIFTAHRKNADAFFVEKKMVFAGRSPVLSRDGLQMIYRRADGETISTATRESRDDEFGRPRPIAELTFPGLDANPRWLTDDGLTLFLDMKDKEDTRSAPYHTWEVTREDIGSGWSKPKLVKAQFSGMPKDFRFIMASSTANRLHLFCSGVDGGTVGVLSRAKPTGPFTTWKAIAGPDGNELIGHRPIFVPRTKELFLSSNRLHASPEIAETQKADLWVIKDFQPPIELNMESVDPKLQGEWAFVEGMAGGKTIDGQNAEGRRLVIMGNSYSLSFGDKVIEGDLECDPTQTPKHLDFIPQRGGAAAIAGKVQPGIYELKENGKIMRFCVGSPEGIRPMTFDGMPKGQSVQTFKKVVK